MSEMLNRSELVSLFEWLGLFFTFFFINAVCFNKPSEIKSSFALWKIFVFGIIWRTVLISRGQESRELFFGGCKTSKWRGLC